MQCDATLVKLLFIVKKRNVVEEKKRKKAKRAKRRKRKTKRTLRQANLMPRRSAADEGRDARGAGERRGSAAVAAAAPGGAPGAGDTEVWRATVGEPL